MGEDGGRWGFEWVVDGWFGWFSVMRGGWYILSKLLMA